MRVTSACVRTLTNQYRAGVARLVYTLVVDVVFMDRVNCPAVMRPTLSDSDRRGGDVSSDDVTDDSRSRPLIVLWQPVLQENTGHYFSWTGAFFSRARAGDVRTAE